MVSIVLVDFARKLCGTHCLQNLANEFSSADFITGSVYKHQVLSCAISLIPSQNLWWIGSTHGGTQGYGCIYSCLHVHTHIVLCLARTSENGTHFLLVLSFGTQSKYFYEFKFWCARMWVIIPFSPWSQIVELIVSKQLSSLSNENVFQITCLVTIFCGLVIFILNYFISSVSPYVKIVWCLVTSGNDWLLKREWRVTKMLLLTVKGGQIMGCFQEELLGWGKYQNILCVQMEF